MVDWKGWGDKIVDGVGSGIDKGKELVGEGVDYVTDKTGQALDKVGAHDWADAVEDWGDETASSLGASVGEQHRQIGELAVTGVPFLASFIATGKLHGLGIGSTLAEVDRALRHPFVDVVDDEGEGLRRDYGLVEFAFNPGPEWIVATATIQLHRLASDDALAGDWARSTGIEFPRYTSWMELWDEVARAHDAPELRIRDQGGFLEYRAASSHVSVLVVDDEDEERGRRVGDGDVWSLDLWAPARPS